MSGAGDAGGGVQRGGLERRPREDEPRQDLMKFRVSRAESAEIRGAARREGLAYGAFVCRAALAAARKEDVPRQDPVLVALLAAVKDATTALNKVGVNFNQSVAWMNTWKTARPDDHDRLDRVFAAVQRLDAVGVAISRRLR